MGRGRQRGGPSAQPSAGKMEEKVSAQLVKEYRGMVVGGVQVKKRLKNSRQDWLHKLWKKCWKIQSGGQQKEKPEEEEVSFWKGGWFGESRNVSEDCWHVNPNRNTMSE